MVKYWLCITLLAFASGVRAQVNLDLHHVEWIEDIKFLEDKTLSIVPDAESRDGIREFQAAIEQLVQDSDELSTTERLVRMQQALNTLGDEGAHIRPYQEGLDMLVLPLKSYWFADGLFICDANERNQSLIGSQVTHIAGHDIGQLFEAMRSILNADNTSYQKYLFPLYAMTPKLLQGLGLAQADDRLVLRLENGEQVEVLGEPIVTYVQLDPRLVNDGQFEQSKADQSGRNYWMKYLPGTRDLLVQFKQIRNDGTGISFKGFIGKVAAELSARKVNRLIIDVRYGGGGNGFKLKPFTDLLRDNQTVNHKGKLFLLTSRATRGTQTELSSILSLNTKITIVGEPTAEGPNTVSDIQHIELPNSGIKVSLPRIFWPTSFASDRRITIEPDVVVAYAHADHLARYDPWLATIADINGDQESPDPVPDQVAKHLVGDYHAGDEKVTIMLADGRLLLKRKRPIRSFFELHSELNLIHDGRLGSDISDVYLVYDPSAMRLGTVRLEWKGQEILLN